jgi:hypothetical protein
MELVSSSLQINYQYKLPVAMKVIMKMNNKLKHASVLFSHSVSTASETSVSICKSTQRYNPEQHRQ